MTVSHWTRLRSVWMTLTLACLIAGIALIFSDDKRTLATQDGGQNYSPAVPAPASTYKLIGWNDLGMHCMNEDFSTLAVLPPYNTMWAQVIQQGAPPVIITTAITVEYSIIGNTYSACGAHGCKSNFWDYAGKLFPGSPASGTTNVGLTGARLSGTLQIRPDHYVIEGIPLTPYLDTGYPFTSANWYPYQRAQMTARDATGQVLAQTVAVAPVSTEMRCDTCHAKGKEPGGTFDSVEMNILQKHDEENLTHFSTDATLRPVLCASCHSSNALGTPLQPEIPSLSFAMHDRHRVGGNLRTPTDEGTNDCYLCHPGQQTQCLRDVMYARNMTCIDCHGDTAQVADSQLAPTYRNPWLQEPSCADSGCHTAAYAPNPGKLYRNSVGHGGLYCEACHGSPHAILPTNQANDNQQNIALQGHAGTLNDCKVCHTQIPEGAGPHGLTYWDVWKFRYLPAVWK